MNKQQTIIKKEQIGSGLPSGTQPNTDYYGNDLSFHRNTTIEQCINKCKADKRCGVITHAPQNNYCWLKTKAANKRTARNRNSHPKLIPGTEVNTDYSGNDVAFHTNVTADQCMDLCNRNTRCNLITHAPANNYCWQKSKAANKRGTGNRNSTKKGLPKNTELNTDYPGNDLSFYRNVTIDRCFDLCKADNRCAGITHAPRENVCWLKSKLEGFEDFSSEHSEQSGGAKTHAGNRNSLDKEILFGVNPNDLIYTTEATREQWPATWTNIRGNLKWIDGTDHVWGVNRYDNIYYYPKGHRGAWRQIPGKLKQVSIDIQHDRVYGVNSNKYIYYNTQSRPGRWTMVPGRALHITGHGNGYIWCIGQDNKPYYARKPLNAGKDSWTRKAGSGELVSADDKYIYLLDKGTVYRAPVIGNPNNDWKKIVTSPAGNPLINIHASNNYLYCLTKNSLYVMSKEATGQNYTTGRLISGIFKQVSSMGIKRKFVEPPLPPIKAVYKFGGLISNNLMCYIDVGNRASYSGSGKQLKDLSGHNNHFNFSKTPVTDGQQVFSSPRLNGPDTSKNLGIGASHNRGGYTIHLGIRVKKQREFLFFVNRPANSRSSYRTRGYRTTQKGTYRGIAGFLTPTGLYFDNMDINSNPRKVTSRTNALTPGERVFYKMPKWDDEHLFTFVRTDKGKQHIYIDGKLVATNKSRKSNMPDLTGSFTINGNTGNTDFRMAMIYNYGMSAEHVKSTSDWYKKTVAARNATNIATAKKAEVVELPVSNGVQLHISSNNPKSHKPGSTNVVDLSGNGRHFKFNRKPKVSKSSKGWIADGRTYLTGPASNKMGITPTGDYSIVFRCKTNQLGVNALFNIYSSDSYKRGLFVHPTWTTKTIYLDDGGYHGSKNRLYHPIPANWNKMTTYTITKDQQSRKLYIDGKLAHQVKHPGHNPHFSNDPMHIMTTRRYNGNWRGELSDFILYNRSLRAEEAAELHRYVNSPYIVRNATWSAAANVCTNKGMILSPEKNLVINGKAVDQPVIDNASAPIGDKTGKWINLSTGKQVSHSGSVKDAHIKCSPLPKRAPYFKTALHLDANNILFIKDNFGLEYNLNTHVTSSVKDITSFFPNLPAPFNTGSIDCAYHYLNKGLVYFLFEQIGVKYSMKTKKPVGQVMNIKQLLPNLPEPFNKGYIDSMFGDSRYANTIYIIRNELMVRYNLDTDRLVDRPRNVSRGWGGRLPLGFKSGNFTASIKHGHILFKEDKYYDYDRKIERNIIPDWALQKPFVKSKQYCAILKKQFNLFEKKKNKYRGRDTRLYNYYSKAYLKVAKERQIHCNFKSYQKLIDHLKKERSRLETLRHNIRTTKINQARAQHETAKYNTDIKQLTGEISDLTKRINVEKSKKCPKDQECKPPTFKFNINSKTNKTCSSDMLKQILAAKGYSAKKIAELKDAINYVPSINDFDIRTHKDYHKYIDTRNVKSCDKGLADPAVVAAMREKQLAAQKAKIDASMSKYEAKALEILKQSLVKYYMNNVSDIKAGSDPDDPTAKITDPAYTGHAELLKNIKLTLKKIKEHPNYQKIRGDLQSSVVDKTATEQDIKNSTVLNTTTQLHDKLKDTKQELRKRVKDLEAFVATFT